MLPKCKRECRKRYNLHQKVKGLCRINTRNRCIYAKENEIESLRANKYIAQLLSIFGYHIQLELDNF